MNGRCAATLMLTCTTLSAQTTWSAGAHAAPIHVVGEHGTELRGGRESELPAGDYAVHFGRDADGKPVSLQFACESGDAVRIAIGRAALAKARVVPLQDPAWQQQDLTSGAVSTHLRTIGDADGRDYRIVATVQAGGDDGVFGLVARDGEYGRYRMVCDRARRELRLERSLGTSDMVLARVARPMQFDQPHTLTLQLQGFRLTAFVDDELVLQELDGGLTAGRVGTLWSGPQPTWLAFAIEPVAQPRASAAIVQHAGAATLHGAVVVAPGHLHVLQILLDRPHPLLLLTANGLEPALLQPLAEPICLTADWRGSMGNDGIGEVEPSGLFASELRWPELPALRHQVALVRALLVTADGEAIVGETPAVPVIF